MISQIRLNSKISASFILGSFIALLMNISFIAQLGAQVESTKNTRSVQVKYQDQHAREKLDKYALGKNTAQQQALVFIKQLDSQIAERKTREQVWLERQSNLSKNGKTTLNFNQTENLRPYLEFDIFSATTRLFDDNDFDGFFHTFSVSFDADVYGAYLGQRAEVFADLYLSHNGGPWELYYTTEVFSIFDDREDDEFEVLTSLDSGFNTRHYEVLIDLYQVGSSQVVASISGASSEALYGLPLESADRDIFIEESVSTSLSIGAGAVPFVTLLVLLVLLLVRLPAVRLPQVKRSLLKR